MKFRPRVPSGRFALEALEQRLVLSAAFSLGLPTGGASVPFESLLMEKVSSATRGVSLQSLLTVSPSDGAILPQTSAPTALVVQLRSGLIHGWLDGSIQLYRIGFDEEVAPVFDHEQSADVIKDEASNTVTIPLGGALGVGRYRFALVGGASSFSRLISDGSWDYMEDQILSEFEVVEDRGGFGAAIDLGMVGVSERGLAGALATAGDRALYKIALGSDRSLWRLGLQLDAQRIGGGLVGVLTVYDAQGKIVATSEGRRGLATAADDPYLFVGLPPGAYYVGVSAAEGARASGAYHLTVVADPVESPIRVTGFVLDWTNGAPTGFTITFSDAIAPDSLTARTSPLLVVDGRGEIHPAFPATAEAGLRRLSFVFEQPIPAGEYRLVSPSDGGLTDLIGRAPVADDPFLGWLANWLVPPYQASSDPSSPPTEPRGWLDSAHLESLIDNAVGPGGALSLRFGVGLGTAPPSGPGTIDEPSDPASIPAAVGSSGAVALSPSFIGVLDSDLAGRPTPGGAGGLSVGSIPPRGRLILTNIARERLSSATPEPSWADGGLPNSFEGESEIVLAGTSPVAAPGAPRLVEFPRSRRAESIDDGARADAEALERIEADRLAAATTKVVEWLLGAPAREGGDSVAPDHPDARLLARIDAEESPRSEGSSEDRAEGGLGRAGLGVPIGVVAAVAVAHRLHRRPPRWWRRRPTGADTIDGASRSPSFPRGPRHMIPPRRAFRRGDAGRRRAVHQ